MTDIEAIEYAIATLVRTHEEVASDDLLWRRVLYNEGLDGDRAERVRQRDAAIAELLARATERGWPPAVRALTRALRRDAITDADLAALLRARPTLGEHFRAAMAIDNHEAVTETVAVLARLAAACAEAERRLPMDEATLAFEERLLAGTVLDSDIPPDGADDDYFLSIADRLSDTFDIDEYYARPWVVESRRRRERAEARRNGATMGDRGDDGEGTDAE